MATTSFRKQTPVLPQPKYSDFGTDLDIHPTSRDVARFTDFNAVRKSVRNLIQTNRYERLLNPEIGSSIRALLFEPMDAPTTMAIRDAIEETISNYEKRAVLNNVVVEPDYQNQGYFIKIIFSMAFSDQQTSIDLFLQRIR